LLVVVTVADTFINFLKNEYRQRAEKNPRFSLRAFAKNIGIPHSVLFAILSKKANPSLEKIFEIAAKLRLKDDERKRFILLYQRDNSTSPEMKRYFDKELRQLSKLKTKKTLELRQLEALSEWYDLVMAQMCSGAGTTAEEISKRLQISLSQVKSSLDKLLKSGLVTSDGSIYKKSEKSFYFESHEANQILRRIHRTALESAIESLEKQSNNEKYIGTEIFNFNPSLLPQVRQLINDTFDKVVDLSDGVDQKQDVYCLGIQIFRAAK
jgi:uncharacterized protein (TIGR02147 family)